MKHKLRTEESLLTTSVAFDVEIMRKDTIESEGLVDIQVF